MVVVVDDIKRFEDEVDKHLPRTIFQKCVLCKMCNVLNKIRPKEKDLVMIELKAAISS